MTNPSRTGRMVKRINFVKNTTVTKRQYRTNSSDSWNTRFATKEPGSKRTDISGLGLVKK